MGFFSVCLLSLSLESCLGLVFMSSVPFLARKKEEVEVTGYFFISTTRFPPDTWHSNNLSANAGVVSVSGIGLREKSYN